MTTYIGEDEMRSSSRQEHVAQRTDDGWTLSWLPGRTFNRNQAVTGMLLVDIFDAELAPDAEDPPNASQRALTLANWAAELGISAEDVTTRLRTREPASTVEPDDGCDAGWGS